MVIRYNGIEVNREERVVSHMGESHAFRKLQNHNEFEVFCYILLSGGVSKEQIFYHIYANDPDGGPLEGPHIFHIVLNRMEKKFFDRLQIEWRAWRISGVNFYTIVPRHQLQDPKHREIYKNLRRRDRREASHV